VIRDTLLLRGTGYCQAGTGIAHQKAREQWKDPASERFAEFEHFFRKIADQVRFPM